MSVKLADLQILYGIAGARDKFEDLVIQLVRAEHPNVSKVRIARGDGGIDGHDGDLLDPAGIDVYQCKFFPHGLGDSQKDQIRDSFKTCRTSGTFKLKRWALCLPLDMTTEEKVWFTKWRESQKQHGIDIATPWCATELEGLLLLEKNRGLLEGFFRQEHLQQMRETHAVVNKIAEQMTPPQLRLTPTAASFRIEGVEHQGSRLLVSMCLRVSLKNPGPATVPEWEVELAEVDAPGVPDDYRPLTPHFRPPVRSADRIFPHRSEIAALDFSLKMGKTVFWSRGIMAVLSRLKVKIRVVTGSGPEEFPVELGEHIHHTNLQEQLVHFGGY